MKRFLSCFGIVVIGILLSCSQHQTRSTRFTEAKTLYYDNQLDSAYVAFSDALRADPQDTECEAYLAETARRLKRHEEAVYHASRVLEADNCNAFAHTVLAAVFNPLFGGEDACHFDSVWVRAHRAVECDSSDGNAWLLLWTEAIRRGDSKVEQQALEVLNRTHFFSAPVLEYNRWVLEQLPPNAILLTNGDLDTYPALVLQAARGLRPDVVVVNLSLLNTSWYERYLETRYGLPLPLPDSQLALVKPFQTMDGEVVTVACQKLEGWAAQMKAGTLSRPLTPGLTVYNSNISPRCRNHLRQKGAYLEFDPALTAPAINWETVAQALDQARFDQYCGDYAGAGDRSPIRSQTAKFPVMNLCALGLDLARHLRDSGERDRAAAYLGRIHELAIANGEEKHFAAELNELADLRVQ